MGPGRPCGAGRPGRGGEVRSLRFCFFTTFYPPWNFGGDGIAVRRLARALVDQGHHVTVIHDVDAWKTLAPTEEETAAHEEDEKDGVELVSLRSAFGAVSCLLTQQTGRPVVHGGRIRSVVEEGDFDVLHFHNISLVGGPGLLSLGGRAVKLYTAHEHWLVCPTHVLWRYRREPCTGRRCIRCTLAHRRPPQLYRYTGYLERQLDEVDVFIALSEFSREKHREFGFGREMTVLPPFLEEPDGDTDPAPLPPHPRPYILFAGRLERMKGLDDVIPVFRDLKDIDLLVAGRGQHEPALRRLAGDGSGVRFLGWTSPDSLRHHLRHALAVLAPTVGFETFGLTLIEAFREGRPVIARRRGPYPEIVDRSAGGLLFDGPDELEEALRSLVGDPALADAMGASGRDAFRRHWSAEVVVPRYLELVRRQMEQKEADHVSTVGGGCGPS